MSLNQLSPLLLDSWAKNLAAVEGITYTPEEDALMLSLANSGMSAEERKRAVLEYLSAKAIAA